MPTLPDSVRPGDLVTADFFNDLLLEVQRLDARVATLEEGQETGVSILRTLPSGSVAMGEQLTVIGRGFGAPDENVVLVGGVRVTQFAAGSDDAVLLFDVPPVVGVGTGGAIVTLSVSNSRGFASSEIHVVPGGADTLTASFDIRFTGPAADGPLVAGTTRDFGFTIDPLSSRDAAYGLTAVTNLGWPVTLLGDDGSPLSTPVVEIPQSSAGTAVRLTFGARVTVPQGVPTGTEAQLSFGIQAVENPSQNGGRTEVLTVGEAPTAPSTDIVLSTEFVIPPAQRQGGTVRVPGGQFGLVQLQLTVTQGGEYEIEAPVVEGGSGWTASLEVADPTSTLPEAGTRAVQIGLTPSAGAQPAVLRVRAVRTDDGEFGELVQPIERL